MKNLNQEIILSSLSDTVYHLLLNDEKMKKIVKLKQLIEDINELTNENPSDDFINDIIDNNIISDLTKDGTLLYNEIIDKDEYSYVELYNNLENYLLYIYNPIEKKYLKSDIYIYQFDDVNELLDFLRFKACYSAKTISRIEKQININLKKK